LNCYIYCWKIIARAYPVMKFSVFETFEAFIVRLNDVTGLYLSIWLEEYWMVLGYEALDILLKVLLGVLYCFNWGLFGLKFV